MMKAAILALLAPALGLIGCATPGQVAPPAAAEPTQAERNFDATWRAALSVLREYEFRVDREDRYQGVITTYPETGASWFEFWRRDAATPRDLAESSIQTLYRQPIVRISRLGEEDYQVQVEVKASRSERPGLQPGYPSSAYRMFLGEAGTDRRGASYAMRGREGMDESPEPLPDDVGLAARIQADIVKRAVAELSR